MSAKTRVSHTNRSPHARVPMTREQVLERGLRNVEDAHFIREHVIPIAKEYQRWNILVHQAHQITELLIKGMIFLTGTPACRTHDLSLLVDQLSDVISLISRDETRIPFAIFASSGPDSQGYGIWLYDHKVNIVKRVRDAITILGQFDGGDLSKADVILQLSLEIQDSTVSLGSGGKTIWVQTDSSHTGPFSLRREIVRVPDSQTIAKLEEIGGRLRKDRERAFYSEHFFTEAEALEAIQQANEFNELAACFLIEESTR